MPLVRQIIVAVGEEGEWVHDAFIIASNEKPRKERKRTKIKQQKEAMVTVDEMNQKMAKVCPELASSYAKYPLKQSRWLDPQDTGPKGEPCFMASQQDAGVKMDYVFGPGRLSRGYYHLLTKDSYKILYARTLNTAPSGCCAFDKAARQAVDDHDTVKRLMYNRSVASIPDDAVGASDAIHGAKQTAQAFYHAGQNEQLVVGAIQTGVNLNR